MSPKPTAGIFSDAEVQFPAGRSGKRGLLGGEKELELSRSIFGAREAIKDIARSLPDECRDFVIGEDPEKFYGRERISFEKILHLCGKLAEYAKSNSSKEIRELSHRADVERARYVGAYSLLYHANIGLVFEMAKSYSGKSRELDDILQDGNIGLVDAVERYDYRHNNRFSTYALWWIRRKILQGFTDNNREIRLPAGMQAKIYRITRRQGELRREGVAAADIESIVGEEMGLSSQKITRLMILARVPESLHARLSEQTEDGGDLLAVLHDQDSLSPEESCAEKEMRALLAELLSWLAPRNRDIVERSLGLGEYPEKQTYKEIAAVYGLTRARTHQIAEESVTKLRRVVRKRHQRYAELQKFLK